MTEEEKRKIIGITLFTSAIISGTPCFLSVCPGFYLEEGAYPAFIPLAPPFLGLSSEEICGVGCGDSSRWEGSCR